MTEIKKFGEFRAEGEAAPAPAPAESANPAEAETADVDPSNTDDIPVLFATIHHQSEQRPDGYTADDIAELNNAGNAHRAAPASKESDDPAKGC